jgi:hypothetical protein
MIRIFGRALVSRTSTVIIDLVVIAMMALSLIELVREFAAGPVQANAREIITNVSVIMIGWGVALEERGSVRDVFGLRGGSDDAWQDQIDHACHGVGVMLLLFGLFAEIFEQLVTLPKSVVSTEIFRDWLLAIGTLFLVCGLVALVRHVVQLVMMKENRGSAGGPAQAHSHDDA